jgi:hypothetical protein
MTESAGAGGSAYDATVETGPAVDDYPLRTLQLADLEARQLVERLTEKVAKFESHLEATRACLADAQDAAQVAASALDAHPNDPEAVN